MLPGPLKVGGRALDAVILVRVQARQPYSLENPTTKKCYYYHMTPESFFESVADFIRRTANSIANIVSSYISRNK